MARDYAVPHAAAAGSASSCPPFTAARAAATKGVDVLGPAPAPLERLRGRFRWQLLLRGSSGASIRSAARASSEAVRRRARAAGVRVVVDVDPYSML